MSDFENKERASSGGARKIGETPTEGVKDDAAQQDMTRVFEPAEEPAAPRQEAKDASSDMPRPQAADMEEELPAQEGMQDSGHGGDGNPPGSGGKNKFPNEPAPKKKWSAKKTVLLTVIIAVIAVAGVTGYLFLGADQKTLAGEDLQQILDDGTFYEGVKVAGVDLSGKTMDAAKEEVDKAAADYVGGLSIDFVVNDENYTLNSSALGAQADVDTALKNAMLYGRQGTFQERNDAINRARTQGVEIELPLAYDQAKILSSIQENDDKINIPAQDASMTVTPVQDEDKLFTDAEIDYVDGQTGLEVDDQSLAAAIYAQLGENNFSPVVAETKVTEPTLTLDKIKDQYSLIGDFDTEYSSSAYGRKYNIWKMASIINGIKIEPGETWSINDEAGPRTYSRGWMGAPGISDGEYKEEAGGGICQVSSTLYGAILRAEVTIVDRTHHSWPLSYVPGGLDATISTGAPDFKIKNDYDVPIYIVAKCDGTGASTIRVQIYGPKFEDGLTRDFDSKLIDTFGGGKVEYIEDPSLPEGTQQTIIQEHVGKRYQVYKYYKDADGNVVKTEDFSVETYDNKPAKVRVGTAPAATPEAPSTPETPVTPETPATPSPETPTPAPEPPVTPPAETPSDTPAPETPSAPAEGEAA